MTLPNFLIIGPPKCATSSLYRYLKEHPEIFMSPIKEPHFFSYDSESKKTQGPGDTIPQAITNFEDYQNLFNRVTNEKAIGEASPTYIYRPEAPHRIHKLIPEVKLIGILRHPADRAFSAYMHVVRDQRETAMSFSKALELEKLRRDENWGPLWHYTSVGFYYEQLSRYYEIFKPEQIKIILFEQLLHNQALVLEEIFRFLEVDPNFKPNSSVRVNISGKPKNKYIHTLSRIIFETPNPIRWFSRRLIPEPWRWKLTTQIQKNNIEKQQMDPMIRNNLIDLFSEDIQNLQALINKDLSHWLQKK